MDSALAQWEEKENSTPDEEWAALQQVVYNTAKTYLGKPDRKHQDWFDPNDQELQTLMSRRDQAHQRVLQTKNIVDAFSNASKKFGLKINIKKTEVLYQPNSTRTREEDIMVDGNKLNSVMEFTYLGSTISSDGCIDDEIQRRMAKASASFGRLRQRLWNNHHVSMRVKGKIYRAIVLSTLLYGAEAWTVYRRQVKKLHAFMMRHLRSIKRITWMDKVTNKEILERTGLPSMEDLLIRKNLRWTGHLMRMSSDRLLKQVLYSQLSSGHRKRGRPRLRFKDTIKRNLKLRDIKIDSWTSL